MIAWMLFIVYIIVAALRDNINNIFPKEEIK